VPIRPEGSPLSLSGACVASLYLGSIQFSFVVEKFSRVEFSNDRLRNAPNTDGSVPQFVQLAWGRQAQVTTMCGVTTNRSILPDDDNVDNINKRLDIRRYTIKTLECPVAAAIAIAPVAQDHEVKLERFAAHLAKTQLNLSYDALVAMQAEDFSYLESTGLNMTGPALEPFGGNQSNCLIRAYQPEPVYEIPESSGSTVYCDFSLVIDQITIRPASSTSW
jgi:hypothetical protein